MNEVTLCSLQLMQYKNFDIAIFPGQEARQYLISAASESQGEAVARMHLNVASKEIRDWRQEMETQQASPSLARIKELGGWLFTSLFSGEVQQIWERSLGEVLPQSEIGFRLRLRIEAPELAALPWEFLYSPTREVFLATSPETPLTRYLNLPEPIVPMDIAEPIRVLVIMPELWNLDVEAEKRVLQEAFANLRKQMTVDYLEGQVTPARVRKTLRQREYHLVHYIGHGDFAAPGARLYLDDESNAFLPFNAEQFSAFFLENRSVKLVVLNTCLGGKQSSTRALAGMAPQLVKRGLPAVVAMQFSVTDDDAIFFAREFYNELCASANSGLVDFAISRARNALRQESQHAHAFAIPVLFMRGDGRLWKQQRQEEKLQAPGAARKAARRVMVKKFVVHAVPALLLALVLTVLAIIPKEQTVEIEALTRDFAFRYAGATGDLLIKSLPVASLYLTHFDTVHLPVAEIRNLPDNQFIQGPATLQITPQHPIFSRVQFDGKELRLKEIAMRRGAVAHFEMTDDSRLKLDLSSPNGDLLLQLGDTFTVALEKCKLQIANAGAQEPETRRQISYLLVRDRASSFLTVPAWKNEITLSFTVPPPLFPAKKPCRKPRLPRTAFLLSKIPLIALSRFRVQPILACISPR